MSNLYIGTQKPNSIYVGLQSVKSVYLGTEKVWIQTDEPEYTILDHITSTGYEYIDTGIYANQDTKIWIQFKQTELNTSCYYAVMGARTKRELNQCCFWAPGTSTKYTLCCGTRVINSSLAPLLDSVSTVSVDANGWSVDNGENQDSGVFSGVASFESTNTIRIFDMGGGSSSSTGTGNRRMVGTLYNAYIMENGVKTHDYKPARRNSDSTLGVLDVVTNEFLTNTGSGGFIED